MNVNTSSEFIRYLSGNNHIAGELSSKLDFPGASGAETTFRKLWELTDLSANDFAEEVARFYRLPHLSLPDLIAASPLVAGFSRRFLRETTVFPYRTPEGQFKLAVTDPTDAATIRATEIVLGGPVEIGVASFEDIATILNERLGEDDDAPAVESLEAAVARADDDVESLRDLASGAPVVRAVNNLLEKAMELRASDIHIEPFRTGLVVRMRIDGLLRAVPAPGDALPQAMISRIKILAGLNIAERRLPQDGAARLRVARSDIDIRVATMPTQHGESAVIRLLPRDRGVLEIGKLGLSNADESKLERLLALPHGMIVVTGPTGSGKTTTLATMLSILNESTRKILTIEDPVEYEIHGVNQSQVKPGIGLTFAAALRAFVRQDPDVIMVGEVRDTETAHIAIHAALTGHLVLTTLHTETAAAAVPRLLDLGVEGFLLKSTLRAVVAQRLVRLLCDRCKKPRTLTSADFAADPRYAAISLKLGDCVHEPAGCERCGGTGYRGRNGVFEVLELVEDVRKLVGAHSDSGMIDDAAIRAGMTTMVDDAVAKCRAGITSAAEVLRVTAIR
ncbi:MAG: ral secretion pathway protein [Alphaproteobacteria bacterium]|jgi:general secretion pathway protein E|nr:ral secretion pathway protein [Alphaproteobacteria bacterium]